MANTAAQSARALEPFLEADFSAENHVAELVGSHRPFPTLRADVADAKRIGIQRLQALVHSNHRTFLQSSRAMATVLRDLGTLKSGVTSIKQAVASMCAVTFAHQQTREAFDNDYSGDASDTAARSALGAALAGVDSAGPTALSARLSASCTIPAMSMVNGGAGSSKAGPSSRSGVKTTSGSTTSAVLRSGGASSTSAAAAAASASPNTRGAGYWRGVSDAVDIALAARKYDEAVDRVVAAAAMAAGDGTVEPSVMLLENRVVRAVDAELRAMPQVAFELHRPLLVCLLDLGRVYDASEAFLRSQSAWLQEVQRDVAADSGDDWAACTHVMDATVAIVGHTLDAHQDLFRGAELSKLTLWAQDAMRDVAQRFLLPTMRSAFSVAAGGGTVATNGGASPPFPAFKSGGGRDAVSGPPSRIDGAACLPVFDALALAAECAGKAGSLASSGGGALGTTVADALVPGLIQLVEAHVLSAEHEALIDGGDCAAGLVHKLVTTVGRYAGFRKDAVEAEDSPFAGDRQASRLWADLLRCAPVKLHGRPYMSGIGRYLDNVLPASFASGVGGGEASPTAAAPPSAAASKLVTTTSRFQSASSTSRSGTTATAPVSASSPTGPATFAKNAALPHSARQQRAIVRALWLGESTLRLLTRALELLPPPESGAVVAHSSSTADREAAAELAAMQSVRGSPLFVDVLDAAMQQLLRSHLFDLRRARDDVYAKHTAGLLDTLQSASTATPPGSPGASAVTADELGLENAEDADFLPAAFIAPGDARLAGSYVGAVAGITFLSWAHPQHFAGARSHHTASLAEKAVSFGRAKLLRPLITTPSPLSIVSGSAAELERYDRDLESVEFRLERFALTAYNSANATPDAASVVHQGGAAPAVAKSRHGGRLFGFYFEDVESASARDVSGLLPFALLLLLKVRQLAFAHVAAFAGPATAACVGRETVVAVTEELLCTRDFWATHMQAFCAGSATQQAIAKEQIAIFFGAWLHGAEPLLRCPVFFPAAALSSSPTTASAASVVNVWERAQDTVRSFLADVINCRSVSLEAAVRNAATSLAGQAFEMHDDPMLAQPLGVAPPAAAVVVAAKAETTVSIASLRESIHAAMGDVAADAVLPA